MRGVEAAHVLTMFSRRLEKRGDRETELPGAQGREDFTYDGRNWSKLMSLGVSLSLSIIDQLGSKPQCKIPSVISEVLRASGLMLLSVFLHLHLWS
jgi:hypothetical protein